MASLSVKPSPITWYSVGDTEGTEGEILASFQLIPQDQVGNYPATNITPPEKDCTLEVSVVGLRGLLPFGLLAIENPFLEFDVGQSNEQGKKQTVRTSVCNTPSGDNPNHLEVLTIATKMPIDPTFAPSVTLRVFDKRLVRAPLIASTYIPLADYTPWVKKPPKVEPKLEPTWSVSGAAAKLKRLTENEKPRRPPSRTMSINEEEEPEPSERTSLLARKSGTSQPPEHISIEVREVQESDIINDEGLQEEHLHDEEEKPDERPVLTGPLENEFKPAFQELTLIRGKKKGLNFFERLQAKLQGPLQFPVGKFKGACRVYEKGQEGPVPNLKAAYRSAPYVVRVYILQGSGLIPKDMNGLSDPYLIVSVGKGENKTINARDSHFKETLNPQFYKFFELQAMLPGNSELEIQVWDYNLLAGDELIGKTVIDLENRLFSEEWKDYPLKPIEWRSLWHASSSNPQGHISLWVDILTPQEATAIPPTPIGPPVIKPYELRAVIWETKDVVFKDKTSSDVFFTGIITDHPKQETDIHWRCDNGNAKFNYRMVWPIDLPCKNPRLKLQIWDKDILTPDDVIAEAVINLKSFLGKAYKSERATSSIPKQYIAMYHPNQQGVQGKVEVQIELLTAEEARMRPAGKGRDDPNNHPFLPPPDRPETSFAPFRPDQYVKHVMWARYKFKVYGCLLVTVILTVAIVVLWVLKLFF